MICDLIRELLLDFVIDYRALEWFVISFSSFYWDDLRFHSRAFIGMVCDLGMELLLGFAINSRALG